MKMTIKLLILTIFSLSIQFSFSQNKVDVLESVESIYTETGSALTTRIHRAKEKEILKGWKSIMKDHDGVVKIKGNELHAYEVIIESISSNPIEVFMKVNEITSTESEISVIFKSDGNYVSSKSDISGYTAAESMVSTFALEQSKNATQKFFEKEEKALSVLINNQEKLAREKKKAEKEIEDCKESIKDNEYKLEQNKKDQQTIIKEIEEQKKKVKDAKKEQEKFR